MAAGRDRLDLLTLGALVVLAVALGGLAAGGRGPDPGGGAADGGAPLVELDREALYLKEALGHYPPRPADEDRLAEIAGRSPGGALALVHRGDLRREDGRLAEAAADYRRALVVNRSFADRTSAHYRGEALEAFVEQGLGVFERERELRPDDENVKAAVKDLYFIRRTLAGGCD